MPETGGLGSGESGGLGGELEHEAHAAYVEQLIHTIEVLDACEARMHSLRAHVVSALHEEIGRVCPGRVEAAEAVTVTASEVAAALNVGQRSARAIVEECLVLAEPALGPVLDAMGQGRLPRRRAKAVLEAACLVPPERTEAFCVAAVALACPQDPARTPSPGALGRRLRRLVEDYAAEPLAQRKERAKAFRRVDVEPGQDGMCWLTAHLPVEVGAAIDTRLEALARSLQGPGEGRGIGQLRADVLGDLLLGPAQAPAAEGLPRPSAGTTSPAPDASGAPRTLDPTPGAPGAGPVGGVRTEVVVTVPARTLTGESEAAGELLGYGALDAPTARLLAAEAATWTTMFVDPANGAPLAIGRRRYTPSLAIRRFLGARDRTCRFPGCDKPASATEADHTREWQHGGDTSTDNLALLCREHHRLKSLGLWSVRHTDPETASPTRPAGRADPSPPPEDPQQPQRPGAPECPQSPPPGGVLEWTSPAGRRYITHPESDAPPPF